MPKFKQLLYLLVCSGAALILWALASRIENAETLSVQGYGLQLKAEGWHPSQPQAKE